MGLARTALDPNEKAIFLLRGTFWQGAGTGPVWSNPRGWLRFPLEFSSFPHTQTFTRNSKVIAQHPLRPLKAPNGTIVYRRFCTEVEKVLEFRVVDPNDAGDLSAFHKWMNDERVNSGWGERGDLGEHRKYLEEVLNDPSVLPLMMCWDGERMGYCEIVWIKVNSVLRNIKRLR